MLPTPKASFFWSCTLLSFCHSRDNWPDYTSAVALHHTAARSITGLPEEMEVLVCTEIIIRGCVEEKSCSLREEKGILELQELKRFSCSWRGTKDVKHYSHIIFKYQRRFPSLAVKSFHLHFQSVGVNWGSEVSDESCMICVNQPCRFLSHLHPELKCASHHNNQSFSFFQQHVFYCKSLKCP